jgi:hypothetical protein
MAKPNSTLEEFSYLWAGGVSSDWVLLKVNQSGSYIPYNVKTRLMRVIENDNLAFRVVERMLNEGVRVLEKPPPEE